MQFSINYIIRSNKNNISKIFIGEKFVGEITKGKDLTFILTAKEGNRWILAPKIKGEIRPFSMTVKREEINKNGDTERVEILTIDDHLFQHKNKFYMINIVPEGIPIKETILGKKYICRLNKPLFSRLTHVDHGAKSKLRWLRGIPVGELDGLGTEGHQLKLSSELEDIAMPLAASCHLMHSTI